MADDLDQGQPTTNGGAPDAAGSADPQVEAPLLVSSHYIKDLSFENPHAPLIYGELSKGPNIDISINVDVNRLQERFCEVVLGIKAKAMVDDKVAFLVELDFAGLATIGESVAEDDAERLLLTETPRLLFPFARAVIGDMTRDGGFPPLLINPIDFDDLYRGRRETDASVVEGAGG